MPARCPRRQNQAETLLRGTRTPLFASPVPPMFIFLVIVITLIAIIMTFLILLQSGKGGGLAGIAAGGATTQILGARQAPDILEKGTWILATIFIVLCILTNFAIDKGDAQRSIIQQQSQGTEPLAPAPQEAVPLPITPNPGPAGEEGGAAPQE